MKKILSLIVAAAIVMALAMPMTAMAFTPTTVKDIVILFDEPTAGDLVADCKPYVSEAYDVDDKDITSKISVSCTWFVKTESGAWGNAGTTFEGGKTYNFLVTIMLDAGYSLDSNTEITINGEAYLESLRQPGFANGFSKEITIATNISRVDATIPTLAKGQTPDDVNDTFTSTPENAIEKRLIRWFKVPTGTEFTKSTAVLLEEGEKFEEGYTYYATINYVAKDAYAFNDTVYFVNGTKHNSNAYGEDLVATIMVGEVATPTTVATTASTSTSVKAGDASNMTLYVIALITLVAGAGITVFATKKSR